MNAEKLESIANKVEDLAHDPVGSIAYAKELRAEAKKLRATDPEITIEEAPATEP